MASSKQQSPAQQMQARHAELIGQYDVTTKAAKAGVSRKIAALEVDMVLAGVDFTPWEKPIPYTQRFILTEDQLRERIAALRNMVDNAASVIPASFSQDQRDRTVATADAELQKLVKQAEKREISIAA